MRMRNILIYSVVIISTVSVFTCVSAQEKAVSPEIRAQLTRMYSQQEVESVEKLISSAVSKGLPKSYFSARLSEAAAKRVKFGILYQVIDKKILYLEKGQGIVAVLEKKGHKAAKPDEAIILSAELLERGEDAREIEDISSVTGINAPIDEILGRADIAARLKEAGYRGDMLRKITVMLASKEIETADKLAVLLVKYPSAAADKIIKEGIEGNKKNGWFKDKLSAENRKEQVKEVLEDKRPER